MKRKNLYKKGLIIKPFLIVGFVVCAGIAALVTSSGEENKSGELVISGEAFSNLQASEEALSLSTNDKESDNKENQISEDKEALNSESAEAKKEPEPAYVYICGEVKNPGLYECDTDKRVADVVYMAGGLLPEADDTCVNLAEKVTDARQIIITKKGEQPAAMLENTGDTASWTQSGTAQSTAGGGLININTADEKTLQSLPGIGEQKAKAIIDYRSGGGGFSRIEDIMNVSGIKDGAFSKIKDLITV